MKNIFKYFSFLILFPFLIHGQGKMKTKNGLIQFEASVPSFEEIKATSNIASCVLYPKTGEIQSLVLIKSFAFKLSLMEEHFNLNYMESSDYPKATFKGYLQNFDFSKQDVAEKEYLLDGVFYLHGVFKNIKIPVKISKINSQIRIKTTFVVNTDDYNITIPHVVSGKVSKTVQISFDYYLE